jgi:hypothetical protein
MKKVTNISFILFLLWSVAFCNLEEVDRSSSKYIVFDLADLTLDYRQSFLKIHLEAFNSLLNDQIIKENDASKYGQLNWISIGYPRLESNDLSSFFEFNPFGFSIRVQMLTEEHIKKFVELIKLKYGIDVIPFQIVNPNTDEI